MNYLAHIYLSGDNTLVKIGNFMADDIKGNQYFNYPVEIQKGVLLHRFIDNFTDSHPTYRISKHRLHPKYGHYSGVIMDILYDHFLAKNWTAYSKEKLEIYIDNFYQSLKDNKNLLSPRTLHTLPYMIEQNWLLSYKTIIGIENILCQMDQRTQNRVNMHEAIVELQQFYTELEKEFSAFFEELMDESKLKLAEL